MMAGKIVYRVMVMLMRDDGNYTIPVMGESTRNRPYKSKADAFSAYKRILLAARKGNRQ